MQTDKTFELELTGMAHGGSAIGRHDGRAIFVPYTIPGERITARITQDKGRFANAESIALLTASPNRVTPRCPHFGPGRCGGCQWQHIDYAAQLDFKRQVVVDQIARIGGFHDVTVHPTIPSPSPWAYRSHITLHVTDDGEIGFVSTDDQHIIPIEECHIIRPELLDLFYALNLEEPDDETGKGTVDTKKTGTENMVGIANLSQIRLQVGSDSAEQLVILSTTDDEIPEIEIALPISVSFLPNEGEPQALIGSGEIHYTVKQHTFRVTAGSFFQVNLPQAEVLVDQVLNRLELQGTERILDLYAGVGLFTAFLAERAAFVTSVEDNPSAVTDADANLSAFDNIDLLEGVVEDVLPELTGPFDAAVIDPPRNGLEVQALDALATLAPKKIVYVSCDPATCARDMKRLAAKGYRLLDVQPVDMFPQTASIELVSTLALSR